MFHIIRTYFHAFEAGIYRHGFALAMLFVALAAIGVAVWAVASRKRYIVLQHSAESDALIAQLGRIAAALERVNVRDEVPNFTSDQILNNAPMETIAAPPPGTIATPPTETVAPPPIARVGVGSMFGFNRSA